jgi:hypothetical protein
MAYFKRKIVLNIFSKLRINKDFYIILLLVAIFVISPIGSIIKINVNQAKALSTTYYINPACSKNGSGLSQTCATADGGSGAKNSFTGIVWQAGNMYLLKRGTVLTGQIAPSIEGQPGSPIYVGAYGSGNKPVVKSQTDSPLWINNRSYLTVENIRFEGINQHSAFIMSQSWMDLTYLAIKNCEFYTTGNDERYGIFFYLTDGGNILNLNLENNDIKNSAQGVNSSAIRFSIPGMKTVYDSNIKGNNIHDSSGGGLVFITRDAKSLKSNNNRSYGLNIESNRFINLKGSAITLQTGMKYINGHPSFIRSNYAENIGDITIPNVNAFQLHWVDSVDIYWNTIKNVKTSMPDGEGIILDWLDQASAETTYSSGNRVYNNFISGCKSDTSSAGINVWCGKDNLIFRNIVIGNDSGIRVVQRYSTNNHIFNNLIYGNLYGSRLDDPDNIGAPLSIWTNNIFKSNDYGFFVTNNSTLPQESFNIFDANRNADKVVDYTLIPLGQSSRQADSKIATGNFIPSYDSLAIDSGFTGIANDNNFDYYGNPIYGTPDIGPIEYQPPFKMGTNLPDLSGNPRIYRDGKYRNKTAPLGKKAAFTATPIGGFVATNRDQWMDISFGTWNSNTYAWTASSPLSAGAQFSISGLKAGGYYQIKVDNAISSYITSGNSCDMNYYCKADMRGKITFNYSGPWPTHAFSLTYGGLKYRPVVALSSASSKVFTIYK